MKQHLNRLVVVSAGLAILLNGCTTRSVSPTAPELLSGLTVERSRIEPLPNIIDVVGTVQAKEAAVLASRLTGRVNSVRVREGDSVRAGEVLVELDDAESRSEVAHARATIAGGESEVSVAEAEDALAKSTLARYQLLRDRKSVSPQEFDEVERKAQAADARLEMARAHVTAAKASEGSALAVTDYARIRAPFGGIVTARHVDPGAMATPGMPLLEVERAGVLQLNASVDESLLPSLQRGMSVSVEVPSLTSPRLTGQLAEIVPAADPATRSFLVKIDLPNAKGLRSGMFGTAEIGSGSHRVLVVPKAAIVSHGSMNTVWVVDPAGSASLRYVSLGATHGSEVEVLSGLSSGETTVLSPGDRELGGKRIEVKR